MSDRHSERSSDAIDSSNSDPLAGTRPRLDVSADTFSEATTESCFVPERLGRYRIRRSLGRGGFADVFLADDEELDRLVALKVPRYDRFRSERELHDFAKEARLVAQLRHPGIVAVYDVGREGQIGYIVLEYIAGRSLTHLLAHESLTCLQAAEFLVAISEALGHAHDQGFVHRDLKPDNILMDAEDRPHVADFGLALRHRDKSDIGDTLVGTTHYMAPEQVRVENHRIDPRTDVWAIGVIFYRILTGNLPFTGSSRREVFQSILHSDPVLPRRREAEVPLELERICLRCLSRQMSERYRSARELADDLRAWIRWATGDSDRSSQHHSSLTIESPDASVVPRGLHSFDGDDADFFLRLLPGPRDRDGLPALIRFWKKSIENREPDRTFEVGLLYGASGCGKSSLIKAGLLPRLHPTVSSVYADTNAASTEAHLLKVLIRKFPGLADAEGLADAMRQLRERPELACGRKVLLVLDQFEQWLAVHGEDEDPELVRALRHCDGANLQCLLMIRDDFWLPISRFMRRLEIKIVEGDNSMLVDSFDRKHALHVLREFGIAYGRVPELREQETTADREFLNRAIDALSHDGRLFPIQLAVFTEMVKDRDWVPNLITAMGGTEGIGVAYLESSFGATANSVRRRHAAAARRVLSALLPLAGGIKGPLCPYQELLRVAEYGDQPDEFDQLMVLLEGEMRLVTRARLSDESFAGQDSSPASREHSDADSGSHAVEPSYQLTHDFLVPSLQTWLERGLRGTRHGRAQLLLDEQAQLYRLRPFPRYLPSITEWLSLRIWTRPRQWSEPQRTMMQAASRRIVRSMSLACLGALLLASMAGLLIGTIQQRKSQRDADFLVQRLWEVPGDEVSALMEQLDADQAYVASKLEAVWRDETASSKKRLRAATALLPSDPTKLRWVLDLLVSETVDHEAFGLIQQAVARDPQRSIGPLEAALALPSLSPPIRLRVACAYAIAAPNSQLWESLQDEVVGSLLREPAAQSHHWISSLRPVAGKILPGLLEAFQDITDLDSADCAALAIQHYGNDKGGTLVSLLPEANDCQFRALLQLLQLETDSAAPQIRDLLAQIDGQDETDDLRVTASNDKPRRIANLALALLQLGDASALRDRIRKVSDPRVRTHIILGMNSDRFDYSVIQAGVTQTDDLAWQTAVLAASWSFLDEPLSHDQRNEIQHRAATVYESSDDAEAHSLARLLLQRLDPQLLEELTASIITTEAIGNRNWYVNHAGTSMVVIDPRQLTDNLRSVLGSPVPAYRYAISATETTIGELQRVVEEFTPPNQLTDPRIPATGFPLTYAMIFCNWLSEQDGLPHEEWFYPSDREIRLDDVKQDPSQTSKTGYRLPLDIEWEIACRGGTETSRFFGNDPSLLRYFGWDRTSSGGQLKPVAQLLPNPVGLFDVFGNATELCRRSDGPGALMRRGGGSFSLAASMTSDNDADYDPRTLSASAGLRVARTCGD